MLKEVLFKVPAVPTNEAPINTIFALRAVLKAIGRVIANAPDCFPHC